MFHGLEFGGRGLKGRIKYEKFLPPSLSGMVVIFHFFLFQFNKIIVHFKVVIDCKLKFEKFGIRYSSLFLF